MATSSRSMADGSGGISLTDGGTFEVQYTGSFSLAASIRFLEGFTPAGYESSPPNHLDLAFCAGPTWHPVAVRVAERAGRVIGSFVGDVSPEAVASNVARILSLDVDAREFPDVGQRDDVVAGLQGEVPGPAPSLLLDPVRGRLLGGHRAPDPHDPGRRRQGEDGTAARARDCARWNNAVLLSFPAATGRSRRISRTLWPQA